VKKFLVELALKVGNYQLKNLNKIKSYTSKKDSSIVTKIDQHSEQMIISAVKKAYPNSSFITEETGNIPLKGSDYLWIIDPLDGTSNYYHGVPLYSVSIGVMMGDELTHGVIYNSAMNELYFAEKGKGAFLNGKKISVSAQKGLANGLFGTGFYYTKEEKILKQSLKRFYDVQVASFGVRRPGAASIDLAWVASGRYDAFWELGLNCWDMAAGILIVQEAGGRISNVDGSKFDLFGRNILASNSIIHNKMVKILNPKR
jgi:myo-inositol-1(or 4)-monophosphatase